jgi:hypothetical protein
MHIPVIRGEVLEHPPLTADIGPYAKSFGLSNEPLGSILIFDVEIAADPARQTDPPPQSAPPQLVVQQENSPIRAIFHAGPAGFEVPVEIQRSANFVNAFWQNWDGQASATVSLVGYLPFGRIQRILHPNPGSHHHSHHIRRL